MNKVKARQCYIIAIVIHQMCNNETVIVQLSRSDQIKHLCKMLLGKTDEIPLIFDNTNMCLRIETVLDNSSYFVSLHNVNYQYFLDGNKQCSKQRNESKLIVPIKIQDIDKMYKNLKSSKVIDMCLKYVLKDDIESFSIICTLDDLSKLNTDISIIRDNNPYEIDEDMTNYTYPAVLGTASILKFDRVMSQVLKSTSINSFKIHYCDSYFQTIIEPSQVDEFGSEWIYSEKDNDYVLSINHKCNNDCIEVSIPKTYCKNVFSKLKSLNKNQMLISFKVVENAVNMKIDHNLDEIGNMTTIVYLHPMSI